MGHAVRGTRRAPPQPKPNKTEGKARDKRDKEWAPVPVQVHEPRFDPRNDAEIIQDQSNLKHSSKRPSDNRSDIELALRLAQKSAISAHMDPFNVLDRVLSLKVKLAVGEVLGVSCELMNLLRENIKLKPGKEMPVPAVRLSVLGSRFKAKTWGLLIKIGLEYDGRPVNAIIDTGSQLNIVSSRIAKSVIMRPTDMDATLA